jgi:DNA-nicking Smr family endonuclease|tara:strand:- start:442 stop:684 length:243 start_codon:yes stop_codon:yes gene_type:complete
VDLHGLRVPDAIAVLHRELGECAARGDAAAHVLVGTAAHHKGSTRLPDAVNEYLTHRRCRFWEPQAGLLEVDVASGDFFT